MILLLDIGNSRVKRAELDTGELRAQAAVSHVGADRAMLMDELFAASVRPQRVLISNVGGAEIGEACASAIRIRWEIEAEFVHATASAQGVVNAYREAEKLGADRWLAVIAAHAMSRGAACVVSVGTAMTIDGVDAAGRHLGGVIVPGPALMIGSLLQSTSDIAGRMSEQEGAGGLFADHTLGAVRQGCTHALAALIREAVAKMHAALGARPLLVLTGGAADQITPLLNDPYEHVSDLVLRGLAAFASGEGGWKAGDRMTRSG